MRVSKFNLNKEEENSSRRSFVWAKIVREFIQRKLKKVVLPDYLSFTIYSINIGMLAGLTAVLFHHSIDFLNTE